jgi:NAD(P)-dependent dehydrogenase (short-subunit alcohol dehydrogenase family)
MSYDGVRYRSLENSGVLITGGASGIGAELVRGFHAQGAKVTFLDIDDEAGAALVGELPGVAYRHCDLRDVDALRAAVDAAEAAAPLEVLVNNAARDDRHGFFDVEPADWERFLGANLHHQFFATQAAARHMRGRGRGCIILTGSISWMRARPGMVAYTAAKSAINGMTRTIARELGGAGIRVNCVVPGAIRTERQARLWRTPELDAQILELQALRISLDGSHVARMALFLASDQAAGLTGQNFIVDAGLTLN